jgi:hypothetical protein
MVVREYRGKLELNKKLQIIERITYDIEFPSPPLCGPMRGPGRGDGKGLRGS